MAAAPREAPEGDSGTTVDAFHRGAFLLAQPAGRGHRAGLDAMILAAAVPSGFTGRLADLGASVLVTNASFGSARHSRMPR